MFCVASIASRVAREEHRLSLLTAFRIAHYYMPNEEPMVAKPDVTRIPHACTTHASCATLCFLVFFSLIPRRRRPIPSLAPMLGNRSMVHRFSSSPLPTPRRPALPTQKTTSPQPLAPCIYSIPGTSYSFVSHYFGYCCYAPSPLPL